MTTLAAMTAREWITGRQTRCEIAISKEIKRSGCKKPTIVCIPKLGSWDQVLEIDDTIDLVRTVHIFENRPFSKIPFFVNDVESYISMLLREHLKGM